MNKLAVTIGCAMVAVTSAYAGEGMWTPDNLPKQELQTKYKFTPSAQWVDHAQKAALRQRLTFDRSRADRTATPANISPKSA